MSGINVVVGKSPKGVNVDVGNKSGDKNVIEEVQVNGSALPVDEHKAVNVPVPTELSQLAGDASHRLVTDAEKAEWSAKSEFSGNYSDLSGKPFIPTKVSDLPNDAGYLTQHQDLSGYYNKGEVDAALATKQATLVSGTNIKTINNESLLGGGNIEIAAGDEAVWGNISGTLSNQTDLASALSAKYEKPSDGIPSSDMSSAVQTSLGKADTALQSHQDISGKADKVTGATNGNFAALDSNGNLTDSGHKHSDYLTSFTETDPTVPAWAKAQNPPTEIFWATYGTTTISEIDIAVSAGKTVMCNYNSVTYLLTQHNSTGAYYYFESFVNDSAPYLLVKVSDSSWLSGTVGLQRTNNRVDDITGNETATNKYPSTKAVADYVAENKELFVATPNVTTFSEIQAAVSMGKAIIAIRDNGTVYTLSSIASSFCYFSSINGTTAQYYIVQSSGWSPGQGALELTEKRVSSWRSTPDNSHYPSEKLVKDSLDAKQPTIDSSHKLDYGLLSNTPTIPDAVEPNPTVPSGTTPTSLVNIKVGSSYYSVQEDKVFWAIIGTTTLADIQAANTAGKILFAKNSSGYCYVLDYYNSGSFYFSCLAADEGKAYYAYVNSSGWTSTYASIGGGGTTGVTDVTVGGTSVVSGGVAAIPAIPTIEALTSNEIDTLWTNN